VERAGTGSGKPIDKHGNRTIDRRVHAHIFIWEGLPARKALL